MRLISDTVGSCSMLPESDDGVVDPKLKVLHDSGAVLVIQ